MIDASLARRRGAAIGLALLVPLASSPVAAASSDVASLALLAAPKMTPDKAAALRIAPQTTGRGLVEAGEPAEAGLEYDRAASEYGDPILYLDAGDAYLHAAQAGQSAELCDAAAERAAIALDLLYFHVDEAVDPRFVFIETADIPDLIARAQVLAETALEIKQEILDAANAPPPVAADPGRPQGSGRVMRIGGLGLATVGGGLVVMGAVGLGVGASNQTRADDPAVYGTNYDEVETKGQRGNMLAVVGFAAGGIAAAAGITLYFMGKRRGNKAGKSGDNEDKAMEDDPIVRISPTPSGLSVFGRF